MSCQDVQPELIAYHFGTLPPQTRLAVEAHLPGCSRCLGSYLALKRDIELGEEEPAPSEESRRRLRRAVAAELAGPPARAGWRWERPFAFGFAAAAVLIALLSVQTLATGPGRAPRGIVLSPPAENHQ